ncbi:DegT/DnrJ/EryC1/StrS family aminotransferase [bacterium]|nr:DegT/DnrJ/EryC1/StrS family aminotransferase [bacterium]
MKIKLVNIKRQYLTIKDEINNAIQKVIDDNSFILGKEVEKFEKEFARVQHVENVIGVGSGTSALLLAYMALGIGKGDKVITTANTFIATVEPLIFLGAEPTFIDIDNNGKMDIDKIEEAIDEDTKAIIAVHIYGQMLDMDRLQIISKKHNLFLIEDCAQAHLAHNDKGVYVGATGDISIFSFYPGKNLGAFGDAGAIATKNKELYDKMYMLRNHGRKTKYEHIVDGLGERMDGIQGAILNVKLRYIEEWTKRRIEIAKIYNENLANINGLKLPEINGHQNVFHLYVIKAAKNRDKILEYLNDTGIMAGIHYPTPLHMQPVYYNRKYGKKYNDLPKSEDFAQHIISLPLFPEITDDEIEYIIQGVKNALKKFG